MSIQNDIQDLVVGFFGTVGSISGGDNGVYQITVPEKYRNFFAIRKISIAFKKEVALRHDCELVIPGSKILLQIIEICTNKGPIALRKLVIGTGNTTIRYHFFITFSGRSRVMMMDYVDVDMNIHSDISDLDIDTDTLRWIDRPKITATYTAALKELKKRHGDAKSAFLDNANSRFLHEMEMFINKYDSQIRDLDYAIKHKEQRSSDSGNTQEFRFSVADRIGDLEKEKRRLVGTLQQKHRVMLEYRLVACEVVVS